MMTQEQRKIVSRVYEHLINNEKRGWDGLDDYIQYLEYLDDDQLCREADVLYSKHSKESVKCKQDHAKEHCFIPILIEAVSAILELYKDNCPLHKINKYILQYYLAMDQADMIVIEHPTGL